MTPHPATPYPIAGDSCLRLNGPHRRDHPPLPCAPAGVRAPPQRGNRPRREGPPQQQQGKTKAWTGEPIDGVPSPPALR